MRRILFLLLFVLPTYVVFGQALTGTKTIPGDYATISAAITDLNSKGVGTGGVVFNVASGYTENTTAQLTITATGISGNTIVFQKSGIGTNPKITRTDAGATSVSTIGYLSDAIIRLDGTDYITFDGIDIASTNSGIDYGYMTYKPSTTDGCQYVTIKNCNITMTKGSSGVVTGIYISNGPTSSSATGVAVSANSGRNENIIIKGNTINNVFAGIVCRGYSTAAYYDQNITIGQSGAGNIIQNFGGNTAATTYGVYFIYVNNAKADYNIIDNAANGGSGHGAQLYGVFYSTVTGDITGDNNSITLANTSASSITYYLYNANACLSHSYSNNSFGASNITSTGAVYLIHNSVTTAATKTVTGNSIIGTFNRTAASGTLYCFYDNGSPTGIFNASGNNFSNITLAGSSAFYGIQSTTSATHTQNVYNNTISNITGGTGLMYPIYLSLANTREVYGNTIHTINGGGTVYGIYITSGGATVNNFYKNKIYGLSSSTTATTAGIVSGMLFSGLGANTNIYNNYVGLLSAPTATGGDAVRGISFTGTTASTNINLSFNTIYLNGTGGTGFGSSSLYHTFSATATSAKLIMQNNILANNGIPSGSGKVVAFRRSSSTSLANYDATNSNNNLFFAGTPSSDNVLFYDGTNFSQSMAALKTQLSPGESNSFREDVDFTSLVGSSPNFLHINTSIPTQIESGGIDVAGISDDFDGDLRNSPPDIGADEFAGTQAIPMSYVSSTTTQITDYAYQGISNQAVIRLEVVTTGATTPLTVTNFTLNAFGSTNISDINSSTAKLYYTGVSSNFGTAVLFGSGTPTISDFSITGNQVLSEGTNYFWLTYDVDAGATANNVIDGEFIDLTVDGNLQTPLVTAPAGNRIILGAMSGTYNIGASQTFPNFINLSDAITDLNNRGISGAVSFVLQSDYSSIGEVFPLSINQITGASSSNTITIKPGASVTATISGSSASSIIKLNGADFIIIDGSNNGSASKDLTIENTSTATSTAAVWISSLGTGAGATDNTIKNCIIQAGNNAATKYGIYIAGASISTTGAGADNNDITIQNNTINRTYYGIFAGGSITAGDEMNNLTISQNTIGSSSVTEYVIGYGIRIYSGSIGANISQNEIFNMISTTSVYGIYFGSTISNSIISRNNIHGFNSGTSSTAYNIPIYFSSSTNNLNNQIENNIIYDLTHYGPTSTTTMYFAGIRIVGGDGFKIYNNTISLIGTFANTSASLVSNCLAVTTASTNMDIRNNIFLNTKSGTTPKSYTIYTIASTTYTNIDYNCYYSTGAALGYIGGAEKVDLAAIQTATSQDNNSVSGDPVFVSADYLKPTSAVCLNNADSGVPVTIDYLGATRSSSPDIGAYEFEQPAIDMSAIFLLAPSNTNGCYSNTETVTITVKNKGTSTIDFSINPLTVNTNVTGTITVALSATVNTGSLAPGATLDVNMSSTLDMSTAGIYYFNSSTSILGDEISQNNAMNEDSRTNVTLSIGSLNASQNTLCFSGSPVLTLTGSIGYNTIQWKESTVSNSGPWTNVGTSDTSYTPSVVNTTTYYYAEAICNSSNIASNIVDITVNSPQVLSTTPDSRCGTGTLTLGATASAGTLNWYDVASGGVSLGTGTSFITPSLSSTTNYYVGAGFEGGGIVNGARLAPTGTSVTTASNYGLVFTATKAFVLYSVDVFATTAGNVVVQLQNSSGTMLQSATITVTAAGATVAQTIPLNFSVPAEVGLRLIAVSSPNMVRESSLGGFPYSLGENGSITNGFITTPTSTTYYYFYNWKMTGLCESARQAVTATVIPVSVGGNVNGDQSICANTSPSDIILSGNVGNVVKWQKSADLAFTTPIDISNTTTTLTSAEIGNLTSTTYFRANVQSGSCGDAYSNISTITVNPNLTASVSISTPLTTVNAGTNVTFTATPTNGGTLPAYQWYVNANPVGTNSNTFTYAPANNDAVSCQLTSDIANCISGNPAMSNTVNMTVNSTGAITRTWAGTASESWTNPTNWTNGIPVAIDNVIIPATAAHFPTLTGSVTINNLTINSDATGTGSLLDNDNLTLTGTATVKQYVQGEKWHLISSPVQNAVSGVFHLAAGQADIYIRQFNGGWSYITDLVTPIVAKKGYSIWADTQTHSTPHPTIPFIGALNTGNQTLPTTGSNNWDLLGNPFVSAIDWNSVNPTNVAGSAVRVWNQVSTVYSTYSQIGGSVNGGNRYLAPMQGFFVQTTDANGIVVGNSNRVHNGQLFVKSSNTINDLVKITAQRGAYKDEINVVMNPIATNNYDVQYDASKLFANDNNIPEIYTVSENKNLVINIFKNAPIAIPMNIRLGVSDNVTLTASEFTNFDANVNITLEDMLTGTTQDLRVNPSYTFAASIGDNANRFVLHFATANGINEPNAGNISIYAYENTIYVNTTEQLKEINVYNMLGQLITSAAGNGKSLNTIKVDKATSYYVVKVTTNKGVRTEKVFVK